MSGISSAAAFSRRRPRIYVAIVLAAAVICTGLITVRSANAGTVPTRSLAVVPMVTDAPSPSPVPLTTPILSVTSVGATSITLIWTASTGCCPIASYVISYNMEFNGGYSTVDVGNVTTATLTNLAPTGQYRLSVTAHADTGRVSQPSNAVTVVTPASDSGPDLIPPQAPTNLTQTPSHGKLATLNWSPSTDNVAVTGYRIYRWDNVSSSVLLGTVTGTSFEVPLLTTDTAAAYNVRASDAAGNLSIASNSVPPNPTGPPPIVACRVTYTTVAQWRGGFVATLKIANSGTTPIDAWQLDFYFGGDQQVTSAWNATASQSFTDVTMLSLDRNGAIAPQGSRTVGMVGTWHTSDAPPYLYILNGAHCVID